MGGFYATGIFADLVTIACTCALDVFVESAGGPTFVFGRMKRVNQGRSWCIEHSEIRGQLRAIDS